MENIGVVQSLETLDDLNKNPPDVFLSQIGLLLLVTRDFLEQITVVRILHNNATAQRQTCMLNSGS